MKFSKANKFILKDENTELVSVTMENIFYISLSYHSSLQLPY